MKKGWVRYDDDSPLNSFCKNVFFVYLRFRVFKSDSFPFIEESEFDGDDFSFFISKESVHNTALFCLKFWKPNIKSVDKHIF